MIVRWQYLPAKHSRSARYAFLVRSFSVSQRRREPAGILAKTRNIGIIAHIDAVRRSSTR